METRIKKGWNGNMIENSIENYYLDIAVETERKLKVRLKTN
jgi:hypothetical protein